MKMTDGQKKKLQQALKTELQQLSKKELLESDAWEAYFNLTGFFKVLQQMKKEAYGNV